MAMKLLQYGSCDGTKFVPRDKVDSIFLESLERQFAEQTEEQQRRIEEANNDALEKLEKLEKIIEKELIPIRIWIESRDG